MMEPAGLMRRSRLFKGILICLCGAIITVHRFRNGDNKATYDLEVNAIGRHTLSIVEDPNCTQPGIEQFPHNIFTQNQRNDGAITIHILVALYMCGAIAYICTKYFVPSLEMICKEFHIKEDVAGASFMAIGSSAPELFASFIGTFVIQGDIGIETIVGSAAFNVFFVMAALPFFCKKPIQLSWYPIIRDCAYWALSIIMLLVTVYDSYVQWWEAAILALLYVFYVLVMYFNDIIENALTETNDNNNTVVQDDETTFIVEMQQLQNISDTRDLFYDSITEDEKEKEKPSMFEVPHNPFKFVLWMVGLPMVIIFFLTIPDCQQKSFCNRVYLVTFCIGSCWLAVLSYVLVWTATIIGYTCHIPDDIMGITFLAFCTSVPDLISSIIVAQDGFGEMAIANVIGSNIFEVLLCLGLLWFLRIATNGHWQAIEIGSEASVSFISGGLLLTAVFVVVSLKLKDWILDRKLGFISFIIYFAFITFCILNEKSPLPVCEVA